VQPTVDDKPVGTLRDLPPNIQREIPAVNVNGYIYAVNPADRSVLINNKLLHEGEQVEPGLILEKLTPKGAVLNFKGYRFRVPY
jgi:general secretion pathway protein B